MYKAGIKLNPVSSILFCVGCSQKSLQNDSDSLVDRNLLASMYMNEYIEPFSSCLARKIGPIFHKF